jgi:hypothetical protein
VDPLLQKRTVLEGVNSNTLYTEGERRGRRVGGLQRQRYGRGAPHADAMQGERAGLRQPLQLALGMVAVNSPSYFSFISPSPRGKYFSARSPRTFARDICSTPHSPRDKSPSLLKL